MSTQEFRLRMRRSGEVRSSLQRKPLVEPEGGGCNRRRTIPNFAICSPITRKLTVPKSYPRLGNGAFLDLFGSIRINKL